MSELLFEYPFGAGLGRWGMMQVLFGDASMWQAPPIHVEIQPTGWLLDGGLPLWVAWPARSRRACAPATCVAVHATGSLQESATAVLCLQLMLLAICFTGPAFNTQLGIQFWALTAALWDRSSAAEDRLAVEQRETVYA